MCNNWLYRSLKKLMPTVHHICRTVKSLKPFVFDEVVSLTYSLILSAGQIDRQSLSLLKPLFLVDHRYGGQ